MKRILTIILICLLLLTLCACGNNSSTTTNDNTQQAESSTVEEDTKTAVFEFIESHIKATLKNPNSLIINSIAEATTPIANNEYSYYIVAVDYSAQNGFGGYDREQQVYYAKSSNNGNIVSVISEIEYCNATDECLYKDGLSKLEAADKIPFALICSATTYNDVATFLKNANIEYTIYNNSNNTPKEVKYLCDMYGFTGVVTITFNENKTISAINYCKSEGQIYYDANKNQTITFEDDTSVITNADVQKFKDDISTYLEVSGTEKDEDSLSYYTSRSCKWELSKSLSAALKWDTFIEDNTVCYLSLTFENIINEQK